MVAGTGGAAGAVAGRPIQAVRSSEPTQGNADVRRDLPGLHRPDQPQAGRKALFLITDGEDRGSYYTRSQAVEAAQRANTILYSIYYVDPKADTARGAGTTGRQARAGRSSATCRTDGRARLHGRQGPYSRRRLYRVTSRNAEPVLDWLQVHQPGTQRRVPGNGDPIEGRRTTKYKVGRDTTPRRTGPVSPVPAAR